MQSERAAGCGDLNDIIKTVLFSTLLSAVHGFVFWVLGGMAFSRPRLSPLDGMVALFSFTFRFHGLSREERARLSLIPPTKHLTVILVGLL